MTDLTLPLEGLSSVNGKSVIARFDGGTLSSDSRVIALGEVEKRLGVAGRLARCIDDPRRPDQIVHSLVRCRTKHWCVRKATARPCFSALFTATKRMLGRLSASALASASARSFFWR